MTLDTNIINMLHNKKVLVTGGTGSFGRRFINTLLQHSTASKVVVYSRDELKQYQMAQTINDDRIRFFIGDVRDGSRLTSVCRDVDIIVHAAAIKHVDVAEYNPTECIKTNINGSISVIDAAFDNNVEHVVNISTDKACNPTNLYGATKLASEKLFISANNMAGSSKTKFSVVRYGNVVGSRGSVIPYFKQLLDGGAKQLPLTHPEMTRFFIELDQGVDFVLGCLSRMKGGEVFIPKLPTAKIADIIKIMCPNSEPNNVGIRPGEKLHETMISADEGRSTLDFGEFFVVVPEFNFGRDLDFSKNELGESGIKVPLSFEYASNHNNWVLDNVALERVVR